MSDEKRTGGRSRRQEAGTNRMGETGGMGDGAKGDGATTRGRR